MLHFVYSIFINFHPSTCIIISSYLCLLENDLSSNFNLEINLQYRVHGRHAMYVDEWA